MAADYMFSPPLHVAKDKRGPELEWERRYAHHLLRELVEDLRERFDTFEILCASLPGREASIRRRWERWKAGSSRLCLVKLDDLLTLARGVTNQDLTSPERAARVELYARRVAGKKSPFGGELDDGIRNGHEATGA